MDAKNPFSTGCFYHIYNKTIDQITPFTNTNNSNRLLDLIKYYRSEQIKVSFSKFLTLPSEIKRVTYKKINDPKSFQISILSYVIMPNHYHFLLKQNIKEGAYKFMNNITNAFTRYFNLSTERTGPLLIPKYKFRLIHTEEELIHVSRYIHLNPYSSGLVNSFEELLKYRYSSLSEYLYESVITDTTQILNSSFFLGNRNKYLKFCQNRANYQKTLELIKHVKKWI